MVAQTVVGQALALGKAPLDLLRGSNREEKVLKNAKDACATEALEIATYTGIEGLASSIGDRQTAKLAASIRANEQRMLDHLLEEIPSLVAWVVDARLVSPRLRGWREDALGDVDYSAVRSLASSRRP